VATASNRRYDTFKSAKRYATGAVWGDGYQGEPLHTKAQDKGAGHTFAEAEEQWIPPAKTEQPRHCKIHKPRQ